MPGARAKGRLPKGSFHSVAVVVSDRNRSEEWYTTKFRLDVVQQEPGQDGHWVTVGRNGENATLHPCQFTQFAPDFPLEPGSSGIQFSVPGDIETSCAARAANGVEFKRTPKQEPWGWSAMVADPDGNEIMLEPPWSIERRRWHV